MVKEYRARETAGSLDELYDKLKLERDAAANQGPLQLASLNRRQLTLNSSQLKSTQLKTSFWYGQE